MQGLRSDEVLLLGGLGGGVCVALWRKHMGAGVWKVSRTQTRGAGETERPCGRSQEGLAGPVQGPGGARFCGVRTLHRGVS